MKVWPCGGGVKPPQSVQRTLRHASVMLADTHVSVLPHLYHDSARMAARLVLKGV